MSRIFSVGVLNPGDVVLFYDKVVKSDPTGPGTVTTVNTKLLIFQGLGTGDILQFSNAEESSGLTIEAFMGKDCVLLGEGQAPEVVKKGLSYVFA